MGIVLFAFSLRSAVASLSPVLGQIGEDFPMPAALVGLIGIAPPVCYAVFGIATPALERRFGLERLVVAAMLVAAIGLSARAFAVDGVTLLVATAVIFAAVGVGNVLVPPLVKKYFPDRIGLMTALYSATLSISTFVPPLVAVPLADAASWRLPLGMWAVFAAAAMIPWLALLRNERHSDADVDLAPADGQVLARLWRLPMAWALVIAFMTSGALAYTSFAWMPEILIDIAGVTPATAGVLLSLFAAVGLPMSLLVPVLVVRFHATGHLFVVAVVSGLVGVAGLMVVPAAAPWLWMTLLGIATLQFPMTLVLLGLRSRTHEGAVALSGFVQSVGYGIAAVLPLAVGLLHDATQSWTGALVVMGVVVVASIPAGFVASRRITIEDQWERRHGPWV